MPVALTSHIPELADIVRSGDSRRRGDALRRISDLFLSGAAMFRPAHVELFDGVLIQLLPQTELDARAELAERMALVANAPPRLVNLLATDDEIAIAGPVLRQSPLVDDALLAEVAASKSQSHLMAIASRQPLAPIVTDVIVRRGDREVVRGMAKNDDAAFSKLGYSGLVRRAIEDGQLAVALAQRKDLSPVHLRTLVERSADIVRRRMLDATTEEQHAAIAQMVAQLNDEAEHAPSLDFSAAQRTVQALSHADGLNEGALLTFARAYQLEETIATLSVMTGVAVGTLEALLKGDRDDPILILGKSIGASWATVRALISLRAGPGRSVSGPDIEDARLNYERLVPETAQRVLSFWQVRG